MLRIYLEVCGGLLGFSPLYESVSRYVLYLDKPFRIGIRTMLERLTTNQ